MPTRRILLFEIVELLPEEGDAHTPIRHEIRVAPRWMSMLSRSDKGIVSLLLMQFCEHILHSEPVYVVPMQPLDYEAGDAIERIEAEGIDPKNLQVRAIDLENLIRAARAAAGRRL